MIYPDFAERQTCPCGISPLTAEALRKRTRIADGGDTYLFATTLAGSEKVCIRCRKASARQQEEL